MNEVIQRVQKIVGPINIKIVKKPALLSIKEINKEPRLLVSSNNHKVNNKSKY